MQMALYHMEKLGLALLLLIEMQIKTTLRKPFSHTKLAKIQKFDNFCWNPNFSESIPGVQYKKMKA